MTDLAKIALACILLALGVWWQVYAYRDCKAVGHATTYCVLRIGR
jgi:hypothetical protein